MLLNEQLIDKLMRNRTLVGLMSSQLKRVIDTEQMSDLEKQRLVRRVFEQMMEKKVDFSTNNVRLAVKTVSSSYWAAAEKQRQSSGSTQSGAGRAKKSSLKARQEDPKGFGRRASPSGAEAVTSKSFPVIDTALKLTKGVGQAQSKSSTSSRSSKQVDASGNPIVVVLLPQERAARAAAA